MDWSKHLAKNYQEQFLASYLENTHSFAKPSDDLSRIANNYIFTNKSIIKYNKQDRIYDVDNQLLPKLYRNHSDVERSKHNKDFYTKIPNSTRLSSKLVDDPLYEHKCECLRNKISLDDISFNKVLSPNEFWDVYEDYNFRNQLYPIQQSFLGNASIEENSFILLNLVIDVKDPTLTLIQRYDWNNNFMGNRELVLISKNEFIDEVVKLFKK